LHSLRQPRRTTEPRNLAPFSVSQQQRHPATPTHSLYNSYPDHYLIKQANKLID